MKDDVILQVKDLKTYFFDRTGKVPAVDGVDFTIRKGETLGIVGESGCGKSVTSMSILKLLPPEGKVVDGEIIFKGENIVNYSAEQMEKSVEKNRDDFSGADDIVEPGLYSWNPDFRNDNCP